MPQDAEPTPDTKNWTWVLDTPCPDCGFDAAAVNRDELGAKIRVNAAEWRKVLDRGDIVHRRPPEGPDGPIWSALEYGAHVRDVYEIFTERVVLMLKKKGPKFKNWDQDETAIASKYREEDPGRVAYALASNAGKLADIFDRVSDDDWTRTGLRSDGSSFSVESIGFYMLHDPVHHLDDVAKGFDALAG